MTQFLSQTLIMTKAKLQNKCQYTYISQFLTWFCREQGWRERKEIKNSTWIPILTNCCSIWCFSTSTLSHEQWNKWSSVHVLNVTSNVPCTFPESSNNIPYILVAVGSKWQLCQLVSMNTLTGQTPGQANIPNSRTDVA